MAAERHINFFELQKACAQPGCPLCRIIASRGARYIDNMLFEHIADRGFRKAYRLAGGFCSFHSRNLESFRDGLAVAILGRDILEDRILSFRKRKPWKPKERCPICVEQDHIEGEYLGFLVQGDKKDRSLEREVEEFFIASDGLCAPHYAKLLETAKRIPPWLMEFHEHKFTELFRRAGQFIELSAYGKQEAFALLSDRDKVVWKELAVTLRGGGD